MLIFTFGDICNTLSYRRVWLGTATVRLLGLLITLCSRFRVRIGIQTFLISGINT